MTEKEQYRNLLNLYAAAEAIPEDLFNAGRWDTSALGYYCDMYRETSSFMIKKVRDSNVVAYKNGADIESRTCFSDEFGLTGLEVDDIIYASFLGSYFVNPGDTTKISQEYKSKTIYMKKFDFYMKAKRKLWIDLNAVFLMLI